jgi:hypothetical protein
MYVEEPDNDLKEDKVWNSVIKILKFIFYPLIIFVLILFISDFFIDNEEKDNKSNELEFWSEFDPIVKQRIDNAILKKDCLILSEEFKAANENIERFKASGKTSRKHLKLKSFVNKKMIELNCLY